MAVLVRACGCTTSLRTGVAIIAILSLIGSAYVIYQESHSIELFKKLEENLNNQHLPYNKGRFLTIIRLNYAGIAFAIISLLVGLLLLGSCNTGDRRLAFPWLGWSIFELLYTLGVIIYFISIWNAIAVFLVIYSIRWFLSIYFIVVVYSFIEALREDPSGTSAGFSPPLRENETLLAGW